MRLTLVIHSLSGGGAERVMAWLASSLCQRGHEVTLVTLDDGRQDHHPLAPEVTRIALDLMRTSGSIAAAVRNNTARLRALRRAVGRSAPECVLSFCDVTNTLTLLALLGSGIPVVVSEHSDPAAQRLRFPWNVLRRLLYRRAAAVVALTAPTAATLTPFCRRPPTVIPLAVELPSEYREGNTVSLPKPQQQRRRIIGVGRLEWEKGFDRLVEVFADLAPRFPDWDVELHGDGSQRQALQQRCLELGLQDRVLFAGWTRPIWPVLRAADLFVLPSRYEGFPMALLEAMASGLPCVAVDCGSGGPGEMIRQGENGLLVPPDDLVALGAAVARCLGAAELRQRLGDAARAVTERYSPTAMVTAYEQVLQRAAGRNATGPHP